MYSWPHINSPGLVMDTSKVKEEAVAIGKGAMSLVAKVGTNPYFIVANAHAWFAAFVVLAFRGNLFVFYMVLLVALVKEFYFDATQEIPKQTFKDNITDFIGYTVGALIGLGVSML